MFIFLIEGQVPERSIGLAWKACVGLNQPWVRIPPCPTLLRPAAAGLRRAGRTEILSHAKVAKGAKGMLFIYL